MVLNQSSCLFILAKEIDSQRNKSFLSLFVLFFSLKRGAKVQNIFNVSMKKLLFFT